MDFQHKKSLGQHFLNSDYVPKQMCDAGEVKMGDTVLEIGPGTGVLTRELLQRGAKVIALEADLRAIESLEKSFPEAIKNQSLTLHHHDVRELNPADFGLENQGYKVVSNIPYYLSGLLFRRLLDTDTRPTTLVFLIQKEVALRIARDKKESLLSLSIKIFGDPTYVSTIKRGHFTPPPKIDSAIVAVTNIGGRTLDEVTTNNFFSLIHLGFGQKRKQLVGNLAGDFSRSLLEEVFLTLKIPLNVRAEDLPLETWLNLTQKLFPKKS